MTISLFDCRAVATLTAACGMIAASETGHAQATVTWGPAQDTVDASDVVQGGAVVEARNGLIFVTYLSDNPAFDTTVGGVLFDATNFLGRQFPNEPVGSYLGSKTSGDPDYDRLIANSTACDAPTLGNGSTQTSANYQITGLTVNENYLVQVWYTDVRTIANSRELTVDGSVVLYSGLSSDPVDIGRYTIGSFTAAATTQIVNFDTAGTAGRAGINGILVRVDDGGGFGTNFCGPATPNSTGASAEISGAGSDVAADNDVTLTVENLPNNSMGYFVISSDQTVVMNPGGSLGDLCIASFTLGRYSNFALNSGMGSSVSLALDLTTTPIQPSGPIGIAAGETWNWQYWYRDSVGGMGVSNFSDALSVTFQ